MDSTAIPKPSDDILEVEDTLQESCKVHFIVMGRTPFYRTSNELEHHFLNIE